MERQLLVFFTKEIQEKSEVVSMDETQNPLVTGLDYDSRNIKPGNLFFALPGLHTDGSLYIDDAIKNGAAVVVHECDNVIKKPNIFYIQVKNARFAMSPISAAFYDFPSRRLLITGVTGTEGKSTTTHIIWQLLKLIGKKTGFISTVQHSLGGEALWNIEHQTTPEAPVIQKMLYEMANNGCEYAVLESSSHGLSAKTNRLGDVEFCAGVLTKITHDHLEFHGTWEQYRSDKANLFRAVNKYSGKTFEPFGVVNADDENSSFYIIDLMQHKTFTYSAAGKKDADMFAKNIESNSQGNRYTIFFPELNESIELKDNLPGSFNCANVMASLIAVSRLTKLPVNQIAPFVEKLTPLKGRMARIEKGQPFEVIVDFAHTPSSFEAVLQPLHDRMKKSGGRIICLFGSAGERDTIKRPDQGRIAAQYSDIVVLTDEDPRGEDPMTILEEIAKGCFVDHGGVQYTRDKNLFLIPDRPAAIRKAFSLAQKGDLVILLGKGHENSIIYANRTMEYDEISEAEKALAELT